MKLNYFSLLFILLGLPLTNYSQEYSQSVYDNKKTILINGSNYQTEIIVNNQKEEVKHMIKNKENKIMSTRIIKFKELPSNRYLSFYNGIGLLSDEFGVNNLYFYDFIRNKIRIYYGVYNKYNEGLQIGKYNPVLKDNVLHVIDDNLNEIVSFDLEKVSYQRNYGWNIMSEGTDVMSGKIILSLKVKEGKTNSEDIYYMYEYNVKENKIKRIK